MYFPTFDCSNETNKINIYSRGECGLFDDYQTVRLYYLVSTKPEKTISDLTKFAIKNVDDGLYVFEFNKVHITLGNTYLKFVRINQIVIVLSGLTPYELIEYQTADFAYTFEYTERLPRHDLVENYFGNFYKCVSSVDDVEQTIIMHNTTCYNMSGNKSIQYGKNGDVYTIAKYSEMSCVGQQTTEYYNSGECAEIVLDKRTIFSQEIIRGVLKGGETCVSTKSDFKTVYQFNKCYFDGESGSLKFVKQNDVVMYFVGVDCNSLKEVETTQIFDYVEFLEEYPKFKVSQFNNGNTENCILKDTIGAPQINLYKINCTEIGTATSVLASTNNDTFEFKIFNEKTCDGEVIKIEKYTKGHCVLKGGKNVVFSDLIDEPIVSNGIRKMTEFVLLLLLVII
ncbi:hypothetical protein EIN_384260 [Entamoeba invadens IP1]|uniref:Uncharacterized protein n=1 Tax=Entamoeba invadens IP1 TaxID=370355 RepID=L7FJH4_ENTIV|nr:hypothetical protein EIN_384260 [Entamoeba invadens IP1]ELP84057.1 hypothetical protein EIN_384260 [Entamoeba invadens IP1]|eukprot:XP_004183403.1 hypothetical protein EIN_384260 [Entamoeba invadens IP1]